MSHFQRPILARLAFLLVSAACACTGSDAAPKGDPDAEVVGSDADVPPVDAAVASDAGTGSDDAGLATPDGAMADAGIAVSCGDGLVNQPSEQCDDGNGDDHDACTNACQTPSCAFVDGSQHPAIVAMAANLAGGQPLATAMANNLVPGISVAIRDASGVVYTAVFGSANNAVFDPAAPPLGASTLFQAASISKAVSALAYLLGDLPASTLDVDIRPAVAPFIVPPYAITPADLLSHSAGTAPHAFAVTYDPAKPLPTAEQIVLGISPASPPGVTFSAASFGTYSYSGGGYMLFQAWLERTTAASLETVVRTNLLLAAGATRSQFTQPLVTSVEHDAACGNSPALRSDDVCRRTYPERIAAGLYTTPAELACVVGHVTDHHPEVLATVRSRAYPVTVASGAYPQAMGIGMFHRPANGVDEAAGHFYEHSGVNDGFLSQMLFFDDGRAIVVMDNGTAPNGGISGFAARALCRELQWPCAGKNLAPQ